jgi:hypothetical protein
MQPERQKGAVKHVGRLDQPLHPRAADFADATAGKWRHSLPQSLEICRLRLKYGGDCRRHIQVHGRRCPVQDGAGTTPRCNTAPPLVITMNATSPWLALKLAASVRRATLRQLSAPETVLASSAWLRHSAFSRPCAVSATGPLGWPTGSASTPRASRTGHEGAECRDRRRWQSCGRWCGECSVLSDPDTASSATSRSSSSRTGSTSASNR